jgi:hypothetical protein
VNFFSLVNYCEIQSILEVEAKMTATPVKPAESLGLHMKDNLKSEALLSDGTFVRVMPEEGDPEISSRPIRLNEIGGWHLEG